MTDLNDLTVEKIRGAHPDAIAEVIDFRGERTIVVKRERIVDVCRLLHDDEDLAYNFLADLCATDDWPQENRFSVNYHLLSLPNNHRIRLKVYLDRDNPVMPTVTGVYPPANWYERECWDMFGIQVEGHPYLHRILMPEDWVGHPLRRDYPLGYEEVQFSFNWREVQARKPRPTR